MEIEQMKKEEFKRRRALLIESLQDNSAVLLAGSAEVTRNSDCHFAYRQDSDFYYLTGFSEPKAFLLLLKEQGQARFILFNRPKNEKEELWEGVRAGHEGAMQLFNANESFDIALLNDKLPGFLAGKEHVYYRVARDNVVNEQLPVWMETLHQKVRLGVFAPKTFHDVSDLISEMRLIKSEAEISVMRDVCLISANAHRRAMQAAAQCEYEYQLQANVHHELMMHGCHHVAYNSIVAAGENACVLHYTENTSMIKSNDLILIDAGGELDNYAADITRTFPKNGKFSEVQKALYQVVLDAQKAGIALIQPGVVWTKIQEVMIDIISQGLLTLGILQGTLKEVVDNKAYQAFYMHNSGHWLCPDVHDQGAYKEQDQWRTLKAGMVLTVEPGIYIAAHHLDVDERWHNIGIRIEDDILVTTDGHENLTSAAPREIVEIEALMCHAV